MTADHNQPRDYTTKEVLALIDRERTKWTIAMSLVIPVSFIVGAWFGIWFVNNLYGVS